MATITINNREIQEFSFIAGTRNGPSSISIRSSVNQTYSYTINNGIPIIVSSSSLIATISFNSFTEYTPLNISVTIINGGLLSNITRFTSFNSFCFVEITTATLNKLINLNEIVLANNLKHKVIGQITELNNSITLISIPCTLTGVLADFKNTVISLQLYDCENPSTITGVWSDLPDNITSFGSQVSEGFLQVSGNSSLFPNSLITISGKFYESFTLDIDTFSPNLKNVSFTDTPNVNVIGNISNLMPEFEILSLQNLNTCTITGNLNTLPSTIIRLVLDSLNCTNTITGDISNLVNITNFILRGNNTVTGDISIFNNASVVEIDGFNTVYGLIQNVRSFTFRIKGNNTISGDIGLHNNSNIGRWVIDGNNIISDFTYPDTMNLSNCTQFQILGNNTLSATEVDNLLISLNNKLTYSGFMNITITGNASPRTAASNSAVNSLIAKGYTVTLNT